MELSWIEKFLFLILMLQFTETTTAQYSYVTGAAGDNITLSPDNVVNSQEGCKEVVWTFQRSGRPAVELDKLEQSDRLSLTGTCSLVVTNVTGDDAGLYKQKAQGSPGLVYLSVVTMTEHKDGDRVTLKCSVSVFEKCEHSVKWLYEDKESQDLSASQSGCQAMVSFLGSHFANTSTYNSLVCEVSTLDGKVQQFPLRPQSTRGATAWWWLMVVGLAAVVVTVAVVKQHKRRKGIKTQKNNAAPEDGLSYASVTFTKKPNSRAQVHSKDEDDAVTYSTVKAPSSSAGASTDPSSFYASVNKPHK